MSNNGKRKSQAASVTGAYIFFGALYFVQSVGDPTSGSIAQLLANGLSVVSLLLLAFVPLAPGSRWLLFALLPSDYGGHCLGRCDR